MPVNTRFTAAETADLLDRAELRDGGHFVGELPRNASGKVLERVLGDAGA